MFEIFRDVESAGDLLLFQIIVNYIRPDLISNAKSSMEMPINRI